MNVDEVTDEDCALERARALRDRDYKLAALAYLAVYGEQPPKTSTEWDSLSSGERVLLRESTRESARAAIAARISYREGR